MKQGYPYNLYQPVFDSLRKNTMGYLYDGRLKVKIEKEDVFLCVEMSLLKEICKDLKIETVQHDMVFLIESEMGGERMRTRNRRKEEYRRSWKINASRVSMAFPDIPFFLNFWNNR